MAEPAMTAVVKEVFEAFKKAGVPEQDAWDAAAALSASEERFNKIDLRFERLDAELRLHRWMIGVVIALSVGILLKLLAG
jgi:hypothetical protein